MYLQYLRPHKAFNIKRISDQTPDVLSGYGLDLELEDFETLKDFILADEN